MPYAVLNPCYNKLGTTAQIHQYIIPAGRGESIPRRHHGSGGRDDHLAGAAAAE